MASGEASGKNKTRSVPVSIMVLAASVLLGYFFLEFPFNPGFLLSVESRFVLPNLAVLGLLLLFVYFLGQQSRISIVLFEGLCLLVGVANHYVMEFKGTPVIPSDIFALGTAADVASGYSLTFSAAVLFALVVFVSRTVVLFVFVPKVPLTKAKVAVHLTLAFLLLVGGCYGFLNCDIKQQTGARIYAFHVEQSYRSQGTALCVAALGQSMIIQVPEGYSAREQREKAQAALDEYNQANAGGAQQAPTVICIMNESFMDMTIFDELKNCDEARPKNFYSIARDSVMAGYAYVSGFGASTCNSEFEFLTGASMAFAGAGSYPYMYFDLANAGNMARYFKEQGYDTLAVHPADGNNWRRNRVYGDLGFDRFLTVDDFEGAQQLRGKTTDRETYKKVLECLDGGEGPQFIFDVTYASHGGYVTHMVDDDMYVHATVNGTEYDYLNEYLSCIMQADRDLKWLVNQLEKRDRPVVLCFFGDHGPNFINKICGMQGGLKGGAKVNQSQKRYTVPYLIWSNYDAALPEMAINPTSELTKDATTTGYSEKPRTTGCLHSVNVSLGYLGAAVVETAGLPMDARTARLAQLRKAVPLVNSIGYMDSKGVWHRHSEGYSKKMRAAMEEYRAFQYWSLFDCR